LIRLAGALEVPLPTLLEGITFKPAPGRANSSSPIRPKLPPVSG
jgi:hypothetical protein